MHTYFWIASTNAEQLVAGIKKNVQKDCDFRNCFYHEFYTFWYLRISFMKVC